MHHKIRSHISATPRHASVACWLTVLTAIQGILIWPLVERSSRVSVTQSVWSARPLDARNLAVGPFAGYHFWWTICEQLVQACHVLSGTLLPCGLSDHPKPAVRRPCCATLKFRKDIITADFPGASCSFVHHYLGWKFYQQVFILRLCLQVDGFCIASNKDYYECIERLTTY